jgi:hypothetical protein
VENVKGVENLKFEPKRGRRAAGEEHDEARAERIHDEARAE